MLLEKFRHIGNNFKSCVRFFLRNFQRYLFIRCQIHCFFLRLIHDDAMLLEV